MQPGEENKVADEWISLFDGATLNGWHAYNGTGVGSAWKAEDGVLHFSSEAKKAGKPGGDIVTNEEFENFHLKLDWKLGPKGNSGVMFYLKEDPQYRTMWQTGPEMQLLDNEGHADAQIEKHRSGDLYDLIASKEATKPAGEWNTAEIIANQGKLDFYMNGQHTLATTLWDEAWQKLIAGSKFKDLPEFGILRKGKIGLQDHGDDVWFRNILIRRL